MPCLRIWCPTCNYLAVPGKPGLLYAGFAWKDWGLASARIIERHQQRRREEAAGPAGVYTAVRRTASAAGDDEKARLVCDDPARE
eukprot:SAG22_NODE_1479_length_4327_cov_1.368496_6_plen_85_part_00